MEWRLPKEHGSWGMFFVPFAAGWLAAGQSGPEVLLLLLASTAVFLSRESLLFWRRSLRAGGTGAGSLQALAVYGAAALACAVPLVFVWRLSLLIPLGLAGVAALLLNTELVVRRQGRTALTESLAVASSSLNAAAAHYAATGAWTPDALALWALSTLFFASSIFYVKLRVQDAHGKKPEAVAGARRDCVVYHLTLLGSLLVFAAFRNAPLAAVAAFAPVVARGLWYAARPSRRLNLKRVGWLEVSYSIVFLLGAGFSF